VILLNLKVEGTKGRCRATGTIFQRFSTPSAQRKNHTDLAEDTLQEKKKKKILFFASHV